MKHKIDYLPPKNLYNSKKDKCEFGISEEDCYFCGQPRTILTNEHYTFCPNCMALYTFMLIHGSECNHVVGGTPVLLSSIYKITNANKPHIFEDHEDLYSEGDPGVIYRCSKCLAQCHADGW